MWCHQLCFNEQHCRVDQGSQTEMNWGPLLPPTCSSRTTTVINVKWGIFRIVEVCFHIHVFFLISSIFTKRLYCPLKWDVNGEKYDQILQKKCWPNIRQNEIIRGLSKYWPEDKCSKTGLGFKKYRIVINPSSALLIIGLHYITVVFLTLLLKITRSEAHLLFTRQTKKCAKNSNTVQEWARQMLEETKQKRTVTEQGLRLWQREIRPRSLMQQPMICLTTTGRQLLMFHLCRNLCDVHLQCR